MERRSGERGGEQHIFPGRHVGVPYPVDQAAFLSSFAFAFNHFDIWSATSVPSRMPQTTRLAPRTIVRKSTRLNSSHQCASRMPPSALKNKTAHISIEQTQ